MAPSSLRLTRAQLVASLRKARERVEQSYPGWPRRPLVVRTTGWRPAVDAIAAALYPESESAQERFKEDCYG